MLLSMSEIKASSDLAFVSEVSVEGDLSDSDIVSTLKKLCLGTHQTVSEAHRDKAKDCIIVGKIVEIKSASSLNAVQKLIIREVTPEGSRGDIFAFFAVGKVAKHLKQFAVKVDDLLIIHQSEISKSCLRNFSHMQSHAYELQVIVRCPEGKNIPGNGIFIQLIKSKVPVEVGDVVMQNVNTSGVNDKSLHKTEDSTKAKTSDEENYKSHTKNIKKLMKRDEYVQLKAPPELMKISPRHHYKRLREITPSCTKVNIMGVIISVENGCQCMEKKEHLLIYLQDEYSSGKNFILNLISCKNEIPPLHKTYIMRALNVLILCENNEVIGWVKTGKLLATVDSDCEKPITLLTLQENSILPEEDEERILELRNFVKVALSLGNLEIQSDECCSIPFSENCSQVVSSNVEPVNKEEEESLTLHLNSSTESQELEKDSISHKKPEIEHCPDGEETDFSENSSFSSPDIGSEADEMEAIWNFVMDS